MSHYWRMTAIARTDERSATMAIATDLRMSANGSYPSFQGQPRRRQLPTICGHSTNGGQGLPVPTSDIRTLSPQ